MGYSGPGEAAAAALDRRIETLCKDAFRILRLSGYARIDVRLNSRTTPSFSKRMPTRILRHDIWDHGLVDGLDL